MITREPLNPIKPYGELFLCEYIYKRVRSKFRSCTKFKPVRDHSVSKFVKYSEKLAFLAP